jgi:hypothetical protein
MILYIDINLEEEIIVGMTLELCEVFMNNLFGIVGEIHAIYKGISKRIWNCIDTKNQESRNEPLSSSAHNLQNNNYTNIYPNMYNSYNFSIS